jgi:hypothetical protein
MNSSVLDSHKHQTIKSMTALKISDSLFLSLVIQVATSTVCLASVFDADNNRVISSEKGGHTYFIPKDNHGRLRIQNDVRIDANPSNVIVDAETGDETIVLRASELFFAQGSKIMTARNLVIYAEKIGGEVHIQGMRGGAGADGANAVPEKLSTPLEALPGQNGMPGRNGRDKPVFQQHSSSKGSTGGDGSEGQAGTNGGKPNDGLSGGSNVTITIVSGSFEDVSRLEIKSTGGKGGSGALGQHGADGGQGGVGGMGGKGGNASEFHPASNGGDGGRGGRGGLPGVGGDGGSGGSGGSGGMVSLQLTKAAFAPRLLTRNNVSIDISGGAGGSGGRFGDGGKPGSPGMGGKGGQGGDGSRQHKPGQPGRGGSNGVVRKDLPVVGVHGRGGVGGAGGRLFLTGFGDSVAFLKVGENVKNDGGMGGDYIDPSKPNDPVRAESGQSGGQIEFFPLEPK